MPPRFPSLKHMHTETNYDIIISRSTKVPKYEVISRPLPSFRNLEGIEIKRQSLWASAKLFLANRFQTHQSLQRDRGSI